MDAATPASPNTVIWIDSTQARIFIQSPGKQNRVVVESEHRGRTPGRMAVRHGGDNNRYLDAILAALPAAGEILLIGPDDTKTELSNYLKQKAAPVAERICGIENTTATSEGQVMAKARAFFLNTPNAPTDGDPASPVRLRR